MNTRVCAVVFTGPRPTRTVNTGTTTAATSMGGRRNLRSAPKPKKHTPESRCSYALGTPYPRRLSHRRSRCGPCGSSATKSRGRAGAEMTARSRHTCAHCGTYTRILPVPVRLFWVNRQARLARARQFSSVRIGRVKLASLCLTFAGSALLCRLPIGLAWGQSGDLRLQLLTVCLDSTVVHSQSDLSWSQAPETVGAWLRPTARPPSSNADTRRISSTSRASRPGKATPRGEYSCFGDVVQNRKTSAELQLPGRPDSDTEFGSIFLHQPRSPKKHP